MDALEPPNNPPPDNPPPDSTTPDSCRSSGPPGIDDVTALVARVRELATSTPVGECSDDDLEAMTSALEAARRALDAASAATVGELDARGATDRRHGHATRTWINATHQLPSEEGGRRVKVARLLRCCSMLRQALVDGRIGADHVRVIANATNARNIDVVVDIQQHLIDLTDEVVLFRYWAAKVTDLLRVADTDGREPRPEDNSLRFDRQFDGSSRLSGTLVGDSRDVIENVLDHLADRIFRKFAEDHAAAPDDCPIPHRSALLALALAEACRLAAGATHRTAGTAADVTYVIHSDEPQVVRTPNGEVVDHHTAAVACCDAAFHGIVVDSMGVPVDAGREVRFATPTQRRAARTRDGGCVFPGCDAHVNHTDLHHVERWEHGGSTDLDNLACLCRHHHGVVHRTGWSMRTVEHQWFELTSPSGAALSSQRHGLTAPIAA